MRNKTLLNEENIFIIHDLEEKTKKGILWVSITRVCIYIIEFIGGVILARILFPQDFGIMAIAMIFIHLAQRLGEFGFNIALVQRKEISEDHISTIFMISFGMGVILCLSLLGVSPAVGKFFNNDLVIKILSVVSIEFVLRGLSSTPLALLQRKLGYGRYSAVSFISILLSTIVAVLLACLGFKIWSLVFGRLTGSVAEVISVMIMAKWIPRFRYKHWAMKELFSFSLWIFLRAQLAYLIRHIDYFIISKRLGVISLGFYERASNLVIASQRLIGIGVQQVSLSAFSRIQDDPIRLRNVFQKILMGLSLYSYSIPIGIFLIAPSFIPVVYGEKWRPTVLPLQILCITAVTKSLEFIATSFIIARGKVKEYVITLTIYFIFLCIACIIGSYYGIIGVAISVTISNIFFYILLINLLISIGGFKLKNILTPQIPALSYVGIMALGVESWELFMKKFWPTESWSMLLSSIIIGCILYFGAFFIIRFKQIESLRQELINDIKRSFNFIIGRIKVLPNKL